MDIHVDIYDVDGLADRLDAIERKQEWLVAVLTKGAVGFREALEEEANEILKVKSRSASVTVTGGPNPAGNNRFENNRFDVHVGFTAAMKAAFVKYPKDADNENARLEFQCKVLNGQINDGDGRALFTVGLLPLIGGGTIRVLFEP